MCIALQDDEAVPDYRRTGWPPFQRRNVIGSKIKMAEVVEALEGSIAPIECISAGTDGRLVCSREVEADRSPCPTKFLWTRVQGSIVRTLRDISLNELVEPVRKKATV